MAITVVIPLYNKGPHVVEAVQSVLAQTYPVGEIIVVDDGSTDGGVERLEALREPLVRIVRRSEPGPGGYAARNEGIREATGEWIAFLDADDLWKPMHLERLAQAIQLMGTAAGCAFSRSEELRGRSVKSIPYSSRHLEEHRLLSAPTIIDAWLDTALCPIWTGAVMFKRDLLIEAGLFPAGRAVRGGDKDLWLRAVLRTNSVFVNAVTAQFRQDAVNRVSKATSHAMVPLLVRTIEGLLAGADPVLRIKLLRLVNQELALYARYTVGAGGRVNPAFLPRMHWRGGLKKIAVVGGLRLLGPAIVRVKRRAS